MRLQKKALQPRSAHSSSRRGARAPLGQQLRGRAIPRPRPRSRGPRGDVRRGRSLHPPVRFRGSERAERRTPPIPLTLRGMHRPRHRHRSSARSFVSLLSVLALLAMACFPVVAQADSVGSVYENEPPDVPSEEKPPKKHNTDDPNADASKNPGGGATAPDDSETGEDSENTGGVVAGGDQNSGGGTDGKAGDDGGNGQRNPGNGSNGSQKVALGEGSPVPLAAETADDGGSSSPLIPILIAIAALAAISIGAVVVRQRRQRGGSGGQVSPKAS